MSNLQASKPPCSDWEIWYGKEIEGHNNLNQLTLFVRSGNFHKYTKGFERIWFCKEYKNYKIIESYLRTHTVAVEVTLNTYPLLSNYIKKYAQIYLKIDIDLKDGDQLCVGKAFEDEAFLIGSGNSVTPDQYYEDKELR